MAIRALAHEAPAAMNSDELAAQLELLREENRELFARLTAAEARIDRLDRAHWLPPIAPEAPLVVETSSTMALDSSVPLSERPTERLPKPTL